MVGECSSIAVSRSEGCCESPGLPQGAATRAASLRYGDLSPGFRKMTSSRDCLPKNKRPLRPTTLLVSPFPVPMTSAYQAKSRISGKMEK